MDLSKVKDLTDEQKKLIMREYDSDFSVLKKKYDDLLITIKESDDVKKEQESKNKKKVDADKVKNANSLEELKQLLLDERKLRVDLEKNILDGEKERVEIQDKQIVDTFLDEFINQNVVDDSLVRDAIKNKISNRLGVRDGKVVEFNGSELTGKTGDQILAEVRSDDGYSNHLVANRASGGGSSGGGFPITDSTKTITREQFGSISDSEIAAFIRNGGDVVD